MDKLHVPAKVSLVNPDAEEYARKHSLRLHPLQEKLMQVTLAHPLGAMLGDSTQLQFCQLLLKAIGAKNYLEIGTFTGCSAVAAALALPPDGKVLCLDMLDTLVNVGRPIWEKSEVAHKIEVRIGPANDSLDALIAEGKSGTFDFIFIDADKEHIDDYYERSLKLVRQKGIICLDNVLWRGTVYNPKETRQETTALREFNKKVHQDNRVEMCLLPFADGVTFVLKK